MIRTGSAIFFDGVTSARHDVTLELDASALIIRASDGSPLGQWPYPRLQHLAAPDHVFRIGLRENPALARLEITDRDLAHDIDLLAEDIDRTGSIERRANRHAIGWSSVAAVGLVAAAIFGVPAIADKLAPVIPQRLEQRLGAASDTQVRAMLNNGPADRPFTCGDAAVERAGLAAFEKLMRQLQGASAVRGPLKAAVIRRDEANAIALPGGNIYVFRGLIDKADNVDEIGGVIAHEIGHVVHRDGTRSVLQSAGLSFLFGTLLGDFVGGGAVILASKTLLKSSYSRNVEAAADAYGVNLMLKLGADARALGVFLARISGTEQNRSIFLDHPATPERVTRINAIAPPQSGGARLLDAAEWAALKRICAGY